MVNSHLVEVTLIGSKIPFGLCKLLVLQHHCKVSEHDFFSLVKHQNIQKKKCGGALCHYVIVVFHFSMGWIQEDYPTNLNLDLGK